MVSTDSSSVGSQLDQDHVPETNGRMSVCRRCGTRTDDAAGRRHQPSERQLTRSSEWLLSQARAARIAEARGLHRP